MTKVITLGLQKGGVSKTTTTGILAYLLAQDGNEVLTVDMDSQGNLTELLTNQSANNFFDQSIFEAIAYKKPEKYIYNITKQLDILPANNFLASFSRWLYKGKIPHTERTEVHAPYEGSHINQLNLTLSPIKNKYDYILIDTPPALSEQTSNALIASDYVIVLFEPSKFCYTAIPNFIETVEHAQSLVDLEVLGILRTLSDARRKDTRFFNDLIVKDYADLVFDTMISRKAATGRLPLSGFEDNDELNDALKQYKAFYKEFLRRIKKGENYDQETNE